MEIKRDYSGFVKGWSDSVELIETDKGSKVLVPVNHNGYTSLPLPSECDVWIKAFTNMKKYFTDDEVKYYNEELQREVYCNEFNIPFEPRKIRTNG